MAKIENNLSINSRRRQNFPSRSGKGSKEKALSLKTGGKNNAPLKQTSVGIFVKGKRFSTGPGELSGKRLAGRISAFLGLNALE
jgi:hypothetical protein